MAWTVAERHPLCSMGSCRLNFEFYSLSNKFLELLDLWKAWTNESGLRACRYRAIENTALATDCCFMKLVGLQCAHSQNKICFEKEDMWSLCKTLLDLKQYSCKINESQQGSSVHFCEEKRGKWKYFLSLMMTQIFLSILPTKSVVNNNERWDWRGVFSLPPEIGERDGWSEKFA